MPLLFEKQISVAKKLAVWDINEPLTFFLDKYPIQEFESKIEKRHLEQACAKFLVNEMLGFKLPVQLEKDEFGKPHIKDSSIAISFSHCKNLLACSIDLDGNSVGIDIEIQRDNISVLSKKFLSERDNSPLEKDANDQLIWGAKEVLYKIYGRKSLDFKRDLEINFTDKLIGKIKKEDEIMVYNLDYTIIDCHFLVWNS
ncbi:MAG: hypothetical protein R2852_05560 [Bacteroidia bacterium]